MRKIASTSSIDPAGHAPWCDIDAHALGAQVVPGIDPGCTSRPFTLALDDGQPASAWLTSGLDDLRLVIEEFPAAGTVTLDAWRRFTTAIETAITEENR